MSLPTQKSSPATWSVRSAISKRSGGLAPPPRQNALSRRNGNGVPARQALCDAGRWDDAGECHAYYRDVPDPTHLITTAIRLAGAGRLAAHRGALDEAAALAQRAVEFADRTDRPNERARIWRALAEVQETAGRTDEADAAVTTALGLYDQKGNVAAAAALAPLAT